MLNIKKIKGLYAVALVSIVLTGCASAPDELERIEDRSPQARYTEAKDLVNNGLYSRAINILTDLETRYPFGPLSRQVQIDLIFAFYKSGRYDEALPAIDRFMRLNPSHPQIDYVIFMRGMVNSETGVNPFQEAFGIEDADKDMEATRDAFNDFKKIVNQYPQSKYVDESKARMKVLLDKLARHEVVIAKYYLRRAAYVAALNRCKYVLEYYQQSASVKPALEIMIEAYDKLGLQDLKQDTEAVYKQNFSS